MMVVQAGLDGFHCQSSYQNGLRLSMLFGKFRKIRPIVREASEQAHGRRRVNPRGNALQNLYNLTPIGRAALIPIPSPVRP